MTDRLKACALVNIRSWMLILLFIFCPAVSRAVLVAWDPNPPSEGVDGYKLYITQNGVTIVNDVGNVTLAALPTLFAGEDYIIEVTAYNQAGESDRSDPLPYSTPLGAVPPGIEENTVQISISVGDPIDLSVTANGTPQHRYDWFRGTAPVGQNSPDFNVAAAQLTDAGDYFVRVSNPVGVITGLVATVTVNALPVSPTITGHPQNLLNWVEGSQATFSVEVTGTPPFTYQWRKGLDNILNATGSAYTIPAVDLDDAGSYSVRVSNGQGFADSNPGILSVVPSAAAIPPMITLQPAASIDVFEGDLVALDTAATGTAPLAFVWYKNEEAIIDATASNLAFNAFLGDSGDYRLVVANVAGAVTSQVVRVTVMEISQSEAPVIFIQPESLTVNSGASAELTVEAFSDLPLSYQWFRNDAVIEWATNQTLFIEKAGAVNDGFYSVRVSNSAGFDLSVPARLTVHSAPVIISQPTDIEVPEGSTATLAAAATGVGNISYQWYKDGNPLPGATSASLVIANIRPADAGAYVPLISDSLGTFVGSQATVTVISRPSILTPPGNLVLMGGARADFSVQAFPAGVVYQWLKNGAPVVNGSAATFSIPSIADADAGAYSVRVSNEAGTVTSPAATLQIARPPQIIGQPSGGLALEGQAHSLTVQATGTGTLTYQWFHNDAALTGTTGSSLSIASLSQANEGSYRVIVQNDFGNAISDTVELNVLLKPVLVTQPSDLRVVLGASASLSALSEGEGTIQYQWYKDGAPLPLEQSNEILFIGATAEHAGKYHVIAANPAGQLTSRSANVTVLAPPAISRQPLGTTIIQGGIATLSIEANGSQPIKFQWFKDDLLLQGATQPTLTVTDISGSAAGVYTVELSNEAGTVLSQSAEINVILPPEITSHPQSATVNEGSRSSFTLRAIAAGEGPFTYQWLKNDSAIPGSTGFELTLVNVQRADAGAYRVRISNSAGTIISEPAILTVIIPPLIIRQPSGAVLMEGSALTLSIEATGDLPLEYQWFRDNLAIPGANVSSFNVSAAALGDAGIYTVRVANSAGSIASAAAEIKVLAAPKIISHSADQSIVPGNDFLLSVRATGTGPLKYQWLMNGRVMFGATTPNLLFLGAHPLDSGLYSVVVTNAFGTATSREIRVAVGSPQAPPPPPEEGVEHHAQTVSISLSGTPSAVFRLQFTEDLSSGTWSEVGTVTANHTGDVNFSITKQFNPRSAFFRLRTP